jgi:precorrin-6B methylase 2
MLRTIACALLVTLPGLAQHPFSRHGNEFTNTIAPFVPSPQEVVDRMLELGQVKDGQTVYDLGCGDGRILITAVQRYHAKAIGIEISEVLAKMATDNVVRLGLQDQIRIIHGDLMKVKLTPPADVVTIYLDTDANEKLRPMLAKSLRDGARVVSHDFQIPGWQPAQVERIDILHRKHTIYLYEMPPAKEKN